MKKTLQQVESEGRKAGEIWVNNPVCIVNLYRTSDERGAWWVGHASGRTNDITHRLPAPTRYQLVEIMNPNWEKNEAGQWSFTYQILSQHDTLQEAQDAHARITRLTGHPMIEKCHRYVLLGQ